MKLYISADIEGVAGVTHWDETNEAKPDYAPFREQMTREVAAACEGAIAAGVEEILVNDAHGDGRNLLADRLPPQASLLRGWTGHPMFMVEELDASFAAAAFVGYHTPLPEGSPLAHTMALSLASATLNGRPASEFLLHAYAADTVGVPVVFVSGDESLCRHVREVNDSIQTVAVKRAVGGAMVCMHPARAAEAIRTGLAEALQQDLSACRLPRPEAFEVELQFTKHAQAYRARFYPGAAPAGPNGIVYRSDSFLDVQRLILFVGGE